MCLFPLPSVLNQTPYRVKAGSSASYGSVSSFCSLQENFQFVLLAHACQVNLQASVNVSIMDSICGLAQLLSSYCVSLRTSRWLVPLWFPGPCTLRYLMGKKLMYMKRTNKQHSWCLAVLIFELEITILSESWGWYKVSSSTSTPCSGVYRHWGLWWPLPCHWGFTSLTGRAPQC